MTRVTLLTQPDCGFCDAAKEILGRLAIEYRFTLEEVDLRSDDGHAMAANHGVLFAPGILLDGEKFSIGRPSERKLRRELERRLAGHAAGRL